MNGPPGSCCICNQTSGGLTGETAVILRGWAHDYCLRASGMQLEDLVAMIPCCGALRTVKQMCGHVMQPMDGIPHDEIWMTILKSRSILRYRLDGTGRLVMVGHQLQAPPEPDAPGDTPGGAPGTPEEGALSDGQG